MEEKKLNGRREITVFGFEGANLLYMWDLSSAGRASALQAEGHRFEPCRSHFFAAVAELADARDLKSRG